MFPGSAVLFEELLRAAAVLVKPGGLVLYVTCALAEAENDGIDLSCGSKVAACSSLRP